MKPNCYECRYRGEVPGDAHSRCCHPLVGRGETDPISAIMDLISGKYDAAGKELEIKANPHGVKQGWFFWPANFDPAWLENCTGFEPKKGKNDPVQPQ